MELRSSKEEMIGGIRERMMGGSREKMMGGSRERMMGWGDAKGTGSLPNTYGSGTVTGEAAVKAAVN